MWAPPVVVLYLLILINPPHISWTTGAVNILGFMTGLLKISGIPLIPHSWNFLPMTIFQCSMKFHWKEEKRVFLTVIVCSSWVRRMWDIVLWQWTVRSRDLVSVVDRWFIKLRQESFKKLLNWKMWLLLKQQEIWATNEGKKLQQCGGELKDFLKNNWSVLGWKVLKSVSSWN